MMGRVAAFLDRDGTLIWDKVHLTDPEEVELVPGAAEAVRALNDAEVLVVMITNQSVIARGWATPEQVEAANLRVGELVKAGSGGVIDACYYCPHHPDYNGSCECRKPAPGMLLRAAKEHRIDLARSFMAGDKPSDGQAGQAAGCEANFLIGAGASSDPSHRHATSLAEAVEQFLPRVVE